MNVCPNCESSVELFESTCRTCGKAVSADPSPFISDRAPSKSDLAESFQSWLTRGKTAMDREEFEEAVNALREAVRRSRTLDHAETFELEARLLLGESLERLNKVPEAADQYRIMSQIASKEEAREVWLKRSQDLLAASSALPFDLLFRKEEFRTLQEEERRYVPLYCSGCKRLFAEGEIYGFRRGLSQIVGCWCGIEQRPLAKQDHQHARALEEGRSMSQGQRRIAVSIAGRDLQGGKKRSIACVLAILTGWFGGHKFYLGDRVLGWIYLVWAWTLVPLLLSLYEALMLSQMSLVTFNMTYNLDLVLDQVGPDALPASRAEMFSLESESKETPEEVS